MPQEIMKHQTSKWFINNKTTNLEHIFLNFLPLCNNQKEQLKENTFKNDIMAPPKNMH